MFAKKNDKYHSVQKGKFQQANSANVIAQIPILPSALRAKAPVLGVNMWSWTTCVFNLKPFYVSQDKKTKMYEVAANNPKSQEIIVKQMECEDEDIATRAMNEGRIMKANPHPNICECLDFVIERKEDSGLYVYIISSKMPKSLLQEIKQRCCYLNYFTEEELWTLATQLITAYAFLQEQVSLIQNIAHRDITPCNILLDSEGNVKVCDFGYAKIIVGELHTLLGSMPYLSPALRVGFLNCLKPFHRVKHNVFKSDVYSLGMCLLHATCLELPDCVTHLKGLKEILISFFNNQKRYSTIWIDLLKQMLTVEELDRPDFITLLTTMRAPVQYADDEIIELEPMITLQDFLQVAVNCGTRYVRVSPAQCEEVPCMISLRALELDSNLSTDIVAVIAASDRCISIVQSSLMKFIDLLGNRDRLCFVVLKFFAEQKCPLTCCGTEEKKMLKGVVKGLKGRNFINISAGFLKGMDVLEQRRKRNAEASILLFSDGQYSIGQDLLSECLKKYRSRTDSKISIFTFGYGHDANLKLLEALANEGKGVFYHIKEDSDVEKAFGLAYGHMSTVVARNLQISITFNPGPVACTVPLIYWKDSALTFSLPDILANQQKDIVFILKVEHKQLVKGVMFEPVTVVVNYEDIEGTECRRSASMGVKFVPWDAAPILGAAVSVNWYRVMGAENIREARQLASSQLFEEASKCLRLGIELLQSSGLETHEDIASVIRDLHEAGTYVRNAETWQQGGDSHFASIVYSHYSQTASVLAQQYSSAQQKRCVNIMTEEHARSIHVMAVSQRMASNNATSIIILFPLLDYCLLSA